MAPKGEGVLRLPDTVPPSSDSSPLVKPLRGAPEQTPHAQAEPELSGIVGTGGTSALPTKKMCSVGTGQIFC